MLFILMVLVIACFFVPGGALTVGFFTLILTPELLFLWLLIEYVKGYFRLH